MKIFLELYAAHENKVLDFYVPNFTTNYHEELRMVNNFLHNVAKRDLIEIAFNFMNQKINFNQSNEEHYFLLWKMAGIIKRISFQQKIMVAYLAKFPEGKYKNELK